MAYCSTAEITSEFKDIEFTATTTVTDTDVDSFIDQASAAIDSNIYNRYIVPVTVGAGALLLLKMVCIMMVKARILSILSVKTPQDKTKQDPDGPTLLTQAQKMLDSISKGILDLVGATGTGTEQGMTSFLANSDLTYDFRVGENNW